MGPSEIKALEQELDYNFSNKKVLIVGAGMGAEVFRSSQRKAWIYAVEPIYGCAVDQRVLLIP
ncbi:MAG: hypothetical protein A2173_02925 [Planctomycetes bacterium RBG_13_44_8b]|nr:MAG: hypothetical protein A2173_02925 [Planctomycetes bacterium RBG_13_44_8b]